VPVCSKRNYRWEYAMRVPRTYGMYCYRAMVGGGVFLSLAVCFCLKRYQAMVRGIFLSSLNKLSSSSSSSSSSLLLLPRSSRSTLA